MKNFAWLFVVCCSIVSECRGDGILSTAIGFVPSMVGNLFSSYDADDYKLKEVMFETSETSNRGGALKIHLVVVYEKEVWETIRKWTSYEYFRANTQLKNDHPNKLYIKEYQLVAKHSVSPWEKLDYPRKEKMKAVGIIIFAEFGMYGGAGRYVIDNHYEKVKITVNANDLDIKCVHDEK